MNAACRETPSFYFFLNVQSADVPDYYDIQGSTTI